LISRTRLQSKCLMDRVRLILQVDNGQLIRMKVSALQVVTTVRKSVTSYFLHISFFFIFVHSCNPSYLLMSLKYVFYLISVILFISTIYVLSGMSVRPFVPPSVRPSIRLSFVRSRLLDPDTRCHLHANARFVPQIGPRPLPCIFQILHYSGCYWTLYSPVY
jgi:hypothetical protein